MAERNLEYTIVTPAHNEEAFIEETIKSVISQTILPKKWVIVSDGSTDMTDEIIQKYSNKYNWIEFVKLPEHRDRQFAAKVSAFNAGFEKLKGLSFDITGNLDADITFESDYFEFLLDKFQKNTSLGVAGTPYVENGVNSRHGLSNLDHVSGACQLFRTDCFKEIGGYMPIRGGGIDWVAVTYARMKGWETRTFLEKVCHHHRKIGTGRKNSALIAKFNYGQKDYFLGGHPLWEISRVIFQMKNKPYILSALVLGAGYFYQAIFHHKRIIPKELVKFHQKEQLARLKNILKLKKK